MCGALWNISGAIFHASDTLLERFDSAQRGFLQEIYVSPKLLSSSIILRQPRAPEHRHTRPAAKMRAWQGHPVLQKLLSFRADVFVSLLLDEKNWRLYGHMVEFQHSLHSRSVFGMVYVYNRLPQPVADNPCVSSFQTSLTAMARRKCRDGKPSWMHVFFSRVWILYIVFACMSSCILKKTDKRTSEHHFSYLRKFRREVHSLVISCRSCTVVFEQEADQMET